jgi:hypothetical protein
VNPLSKCDDPTKTLGEKAAFELFEAMKCLLRAERFYRHTIVGPQILAQRLEVKQLFDLVDQNYNG